jgi:hypothetical protein
MEIATSEDPLYDADVEKEHGVPAVVTGGHDRDRAGPAPRHPEYNASVRGARTPNRLAV